MGENYGTMEELWKAFDKIEEIYYAKINLPNSGEILQKFEKEKLPVMSERVIKNINTQNSMLLQSKEVEINTLKEISVFLIE